MRRYVVLTGVFVVAAAAWLLLDADPDGRQELVDRITSAFSAQEEESAPPNWGDVATKVGEFTEEERQLREVLNPALGDGLSVEGEAAETPAPDETP
jgi:hypothetical protein